MTSTAPETTNFSPRLRILMGRTSTMRRREIWWNAVKFLSVFTAGVFALTVFTVLLHAINSSESSIAIFFLLFFAPLLFLIDCSTRFLVICWPVLLYLWAGVWTVRRRTLLALIQTSIETKTPFAAMVRAYACDSYSPAFRKRLNRFADILEQGHSLELTMQWDKGLLPYDVVGMIHLGGDDLTTLRSIESTAGEERDCSSIRSMAILRFTYLLSIITPLLFTVAFMMCTLVPKFESIFRDFSIELPVMTQAVIAVSKGFIKNGGGLSTLLIFLGILLWCLFLVIQSNIVLWRPPLFRRMFRDTDSARLLRLLSVGIKHHASIPKILQIYQIIVPSRYLKRQALNIEKYIMKGHNWVASLKKKCVLGEAEASLLETAERTGNTVAVLDQIAVSKERTQIRRDDITSKLVFIPCIFGLACIVGFFAIAMFLPLVNLVCSLTLIH